MNDGKENTKNWEGLVKGKEWREEPLFHQSVVKGIADEFGGGSQVELFKQAGAIGTNRIHTE